MRQVTESFSGIMIKSVVLIRICPMFPVARSLSEDEMLQLRAEGKTYIVLSSISRWFGRILISREDEGFLSLFALLTRRNAQVRAHHLPLERRNEQIAVGQHLEGIRLR